MASTIPLQPSVPLFYSTITLQVKFSMTRSHYHVKSEKLHHLVNIQFPCFPCAVATLLTWITLISTAASRTITNHPLWCVVGVGIVIVGIAIVDKS